MSARENGSAVSLGVSLNTKESKRNRLRPQYHYLYGSTDVMSPTSPPSTIGSPGMESESLLGEGLILTDGEEDALSINEQDKQRVMLTNIGTGNRSLLPPLPGYDVGDEDETSNLLLGPVPPPPPRPKPCYSRCCDSFHNMPFVKGDHPIGHVVRVLLVMTMAICMCTVVMVLSADSRQMGGPGPNFRRGPRLDDIPFPVVDRDLYSDPARDIVNVDLFDPSLLFKGTLVSSITNRSVDPLLRVPFPTGAFWTNLVVAPTADRGFCYPVVVYPYAYKWSETLLQASYPPLHRTTDTISIRDSVIPDVTFGTAEDVTRRHIMAFDALSVTIRFFLDTGGFWENYMVQGSPYVTIKYQDATPEIRALSTFSDVSCPFDAHGNYKDGNGKNSTRRNLNWGVCTPYDPLSSDSASTQGLKVLHGVQFLLQTQEGLTWMLFSSDPIALTFDTLRRTTVTAAERFSGIFRLALIPPLAGDVSKPVNGSAPLSASTGLRRLIYHSPKYPTSGHVSWEFHPEASQKASPLTNAKQAIGLSGDAFTLGKRTEDRIATLRFHFETEMMNENSATSVSSLLMLSLPHHARSMPSETILSSSEFDLAYVCIKGAMTPVVSDTWAYDIALNAPDFDDVDMMVYAKGLAPSVRNLIMESVQKDLTRVLPTLDENIYGFGKQTARLAQLAHIADMMDYSAFAQGNHTQNVTKPTASPAFADAKSKLHSFLVSFFDGQETDKLVFDAKFGGIVSQDGLYNSEADFGNGRYNDHHFHYGYILYACAIMGHMNASFVSEYGAHVDTLMFDIAYNGNANSQTLDSAFFPLARHKSWYDGHSYATGLFPFGNGKSQESSSEAVNAYYGAYLWSMVREGSQDDALYEMTDFAKLLLETEILGARTYWHMLPNYDLKDLKGVEEKTDVYNPDFRKNYMVGNLGMTDVVCSTWFGTASLYVHMINFMPVTAVTSVLFNRSYVEKEFNAVLAPILANVEMAWRGYVVADQAIVDPAAAWEEAQKLVSYELDSALSTSQVLYWISTRSDFKVPSQEKTNSTAASPTGPSEDFDPNSKSTLCEENSACTKLGLTGLCCPTGQGTFLQCCSSKL